MREGVIKLTRFVSIKSSLSDLVSDDRGGHLQFYRRYSHLVSSRVVPQFRPCIRIQSIDVIITASNIDNAIGNSRI